MSIKTTKLLKESIEILYDFGLGRKFLDITLKTLSVREKKKTEKFDFLQVKTNIPKKVLRN